VLRGEHPDHGGAGTADVGVLVHNCGVGNVIDETKSYTGVSPDVTSAHALTEDEALDAGLKWLGDGYREIGKPGSGVYRSADGLRQFRIDKGSLAGSHSPGVPHVHFEIYAPGARVPSVNNHVPLG
jgi:hypothetical protein